MRRYDEVVAVEGAADASGEPSRFLWRGRLYVVRGVLAHWVELGAWWLQRDRAGLPVTINGGGREVWRVEARAGRSSADGVYDLAYDEGARAWSLTHAVD
jgi:Family of unknown function (DUF6504)